MAPVFYAVGNSPDSMEMLNSFVSTDNRAHDDNFKHPAGNVITSGRRGRF